MKKILMVLAVTAIAYSSAEAQVKCAVIPKPVVTVHTEQVNTCKLLPKDVCTISPDRRSVTCYKTVDEQNLTPYGTQTTYYGPTGDIPGKKARFETETIIIKRSETPEYCSRDLASKVTTCRSSGLRICRDENGYYNYCPAAAATNNDKPVHSNYAQNAATSYPWHAGGTAAVLK